MEIKSDPGSDEHIIKKVIHGDTESFRLIVERYQKHIFSVGMRFFKNTEESYDFTQEVFIKAFSSLKSFKGWAPFRFWLTKIAYNHGKNKIKSIKEEIDLSVISILSHEQGPDKRHLKGEIKTLILDAVEQLPDGYRVCLDFYFFWGLSYTQISHITGFPVNTIKSNVFRAKQILRDKLKGSIAEDYHEM